MPNTRLCPICKTVFAPQRKTAIHCKAPFCKRARQKQRWQKWQQKEEANGTYRVKQNAWQQQFRQRTGYGRDYELRTRYGITLVQWMAMVEAVDGKCQICNKSDEALCVDHCHTTGVIRGVLCRKCNRAIGQLGDSVEALQKAVSYLTKAYDMG